MDAYLSEFASSAITASGAVLAICSAFLVYIRTKKDVKQLLRGGTLYFLVISIMAGIVVLYTTLLYFKLGTTQDLSEYIRKSMDVNLEIAWISFCTQLGAFIVMIISFFASWNPSNR